MRMLFRNLEVPGDGSPPLPGSNSTDALIQLLLFVSCFSSVLLHGSQFVCLRQGGTRLGAGSFFLL